MRTIWIIRHGEPNFPNGKAVCLGSKLDLSLGHRGIEQAEALCKAFSNELIAGVYCSPLARSIETAHIISAGRWPIYSIEYLKELDAGEWEGKTFEELKSQYGDLYKLRGIDNSVPPLNGEPVYSGLDRMCYAIAMTRGNCIIVGHNGLNKSLLSKLTNTPTEKIFDIPQPYGCINTLTEDAGKLTALKIGVMPYRCPSESDFTRYFTKCGTPQQVIDHCRTVAELCLEISDDLENKGHYLDSKLLYAAAYLHDIMRTEAQHAEKGAVFLLKQGYPDTSDIIRCHHDISDEHIAALDEHAVLYFADKLVIGTERVSIEERFAQSGEKCIDGEAKISHDRRYEAAVRIKNNIGEITNKEY